MANALYCSQIAVIQIQAHTTADTAHGVQHTAGVCRNDSLHRDPIVLVAQIGCGELRQALDTVAEKPFMLAGGDARRRVEKRIEAGADRVDMVSLRLNIELCLQFGEFLWMAGGHIRLASSRARSYSDH